MSQIDVNAQSFWKYVILETLIVYTKGQKEFNFPKMLQDGQEVPRPEISGVLRKGIGEPQGQLADWRASFIERNEGFHAREFKDRYRCHIDRVDPSKDKLGHLVTDSPHLVVLGIVTMAVTALLGYYLLKHK